VQREVGEGCGDVGAVGEGAAQGAAQGDGGGQVGRARVLPGDAQVVCLEPVGQGLDRGEVVGGDVLLAVRAEGPGVEGVEELLDQGQIGHDTTIVRSWC
jgi:hypothetical protein